MMDLRLLLKSCLRVCLTTVVLGLCGCSLVPQDEHHRTPLPARELKAPERDSGWTDKPGWHARHWMVAAANPVAVDAGYE
ncbi:MAG: hypothetical protein WCA45_08940, partial [Thiobacillaceae bacterium]